MGVCMRTHQSRDEVIDQLADATAQLANTAAEIGLDSLVYILRMAEIEARKSITSRRAPRKHAARMAGTAVDLGDQSALGA